MPDATTLNLLDLSYPDARSHYFTFSKALTTASTLFLQFETQINRDIFHTLTITHPVNYENLQWPGIRHSR